MSPTNYSRSCSLVKKNDSFLDDILAAIADGKTIDWEQWEASSKLSDHQIRALQAMERNRLFPRQPSSPIISHTAGVDEGRHNSISKESGRTADPEERILRFPDLRKEFTSFFSLHDRLSSSHQDPISERANHPIVLDDFKILRKIGMGGMAAVYEARQLSLKRRVAVKILPPHLSFRNETVKKFQREAEACSRQNHPGIVSVYTIGQQEGLHYIVMELVEGGYSLADRLVKLSSNACPPMGYFRETASFIAEVAEALEQAHSSNVIHRDIKPSNILITPKGRPKITDFGLAKVEDALALSRTGDFSGTPYYMSPEQATTRKSCIDHRTDIYSLGVTLYEMMTFKRPFGGKSTHDILKQVATQEPKNPTKVYPRVPRDLAAICLKAMEKEPSRRYQTMKELADDLHRFLQGEVILARLSGPATQVWKLVKRNPLVSGALTVTLAAILIAAIVIPWSLIQMEIDKNTTLEATDKYKVTDTLVKRLLLLISADKSIPDDTVLNLIHDFEEEIESNFHDKPLDEAGAKMASGIIAAQRGFPEETARLFQKVVETRIRLLGKDNDETLNAMAAYSRVLDRLGHSEESDNIFEEVIERTRNAFGNQDFFTLKMLRTKVHRIFLEGNFYEARVLCEEALGILSLGCFDDFTFGGLPLENCVLTVEWIPRFLKKELYPLEEFQEEVSLQNMADLLVLDFKENMAKIHAKNAQHDEAEKYFKEVFDGRLNTIDHKSIRIIRVFRKLINSMINQNKLDEVDAIRDQYFDLCLDAIVEKPYQASLMLQLFALNSHNQGRINEAIGVLKKAIAIQVQCKIQEKPSFWNLVKDLSFYYLKLGHLSLAEETSETAYYAIVTLQGEDHAMSLNFQHAWADTLIHQHKWDKAEALLISGMMTLADCQKSNYRLWKKYLSSCLTYIFYRFLEKE